MPCGATDWCGGFRTEICLMKAIILKNSWNEEPDVLVNSNQHNVILLKALASPPPKREI